MNRTLRRITAPSLEPVTLEDVKAHARITEADEDAHIGDFLIPAARDAVEAATGFALMTQTWRLTLPHFPLDGLSPIALAYPPFGAVTVFSYIDTSGNSQAMVAGTHYQVNAESLPATLSPEPGTSWPSTLPDEANAVTIEWTAGAATREAVDPQHRLGVLFLVAHWIWNREAVLSGQGVGALEVPLTFRHVVGQNRVWNF